MDTKTAVAICGLAGAPLVAVLGFAAKSWNEQLVAQQVEARIAPMAETQQQAVDELSGIKFQLRLDDDREAYRECLVDHDEEYCDHESDWRWDVLYPWQDCMAQHRTRKQGEEACGERPEYG